jgi:hypothetical protein
MPEMWPRWKEDETRSELGSTGIEVVAGYRDRYGDGWWVIDTNRGDKPSEKAVDWYRNRDTAKERAEDVYNARMQKIQLDGPRMRRALGLPEGTIWERMEKARKAVRSKREEAKKDFETEMEFLQQLHDASLCRTCAVSGPGGCNGSLAARCSEYVPKKDPLDTTCPRCGAPCEEDGFGWACSKCEWKQN